VREPRDALTDRRVTRALFAAMVFVVPAPFFMLFVVGWVPLACTIAKLLPLLAVAPFTGEFGVVIVAAMQGHMRRFRTMNASIEMAAPDPEEAGAPFAHEDTLPLAIGQLLRADDDAEAVIRRRRRAHGPVVVDVLVLVVADEQYSEHREQSGAIGSEHVPSSASHMRT
jgi:hypothetical protein